MSILLGAAALTCGQADAACVAFTDPVYLRIITSNPKELLGHYPQGGTGLSNEVHSIASVGGEVLAAIALAVPYASRTQKTAIGQGLAQAKEDCLSKMPMLPRQIDQLVRRIGDRDVARAYGQTDDDTSSAVDSLDDPSASDGTRSGALIGPVTTLNSTKLYDPFAPIK